MNVDDVLLIHLFSVCRQLSSTFTSVGIGDLTFEVVLLQHASYFLAVLTSVVYPLLLLDATYIQINSKMSVQLLRYINVLHLCTDFEVCWE